MECPTCGDELKVIVVRRPIYGEDARCGGGSLPIVGYEEVEETCECPRCKGAY